jgi:putative hydrolase
MADTLNETIAGKLREMADVLEQQEADGFRISAYRRAAGTVESLTSTIGDIARADGLDGLMALPAIGRGIALAIMEMLSTGRWSQLERLRGSLQPEQLFQTLPGIGPELAARIHGELHIDTLEALELAAHDGRLAAVPGLGHRRVAGIRAALTERLGRQRIRALLRAKAPPVALLLEVDREYREKAAAGSLRLIAPKRFNPTGEAWLPVLHTARDHWRFTALFSNTRKAHELGKTKDWVVIYAHMNTEPESQLTVVTERSGPLSGRRVVRGREAECGPYYGAMEKGSPVPVPSPRLTGPAGGVFQAAAEADRSGDTDRERPAARRGSI